MRLSCPLSAVFSEGFFYDILPVILKMGVIVKMW
jgi:hypothetical protein